MTRAEAAAQAAWAIAELAIEREPTMTYRRAVEDDLAAALLVLMDPAEAIRAFLDAPVTPTFSCECGKKFPSEVKRHDHWQRCNARP